jgi:hypothetical protein
MYQFGIIQVPADWTSDSIVGFDEETYHLMKDQIQPGTRLLLYKPAPVNAIMAEADILINRFERVEDWKGINNSQAPKTSRGKPAQYVLPLRILYTHHGADQVPLDHILDQLDLNALPSTDWIPLSSNEYNGLINYT